MCRSANHYIRRQSERPIEWRYYFGVQVIFRSYHFRGSCSFWVVHVVLLQKLSYNLWKKMSSEKGNVARKRAQKYQNVTGFKNDKYDKSEKMKRLNAIVHAGVCKRCKEVLEWKIKYKKYKPLSQARKCIKCLQKTVKDSYHIMCKPCAFKLELCAKCGKKEEIVNPLASVGDQRENSTAEINPGTRSRIKSGKEDDDDNSIDGSDFGSDEDSNVRDEDHSIRFTLTRPSTQQTDSALQKEKTSKPERPEAQGVPDISALALNAMRDAV